MNDIETRRKQILETVISEYIDHALPISSEFLKNECSLNISPATIRLDLVELTRDGFLQKAHISSGRVPTDKGYRFFVDGLFNTNIDFAMDKILKEFNDIFDELADIAKLSHELANELAETSHNLSIVCFGDSDVLYKEGWEEAIKAPEFNDVKYLRGFVDFVGDFEKELKTIDFKKGEKVKIFIGKESPFSKKEFSVIVGVAETKDKKQQPRFALLGPKRMDFKKNISLINSLIETVENFNY